MWRSDEGELVMWVLVGFCGLLWCFMATWTVLNLLQLLFNVHTRQEESRRHEARE